MAADTLLRNVYAGFDPNKDMMDLILEVVYVSWFWRTWNGGRMPTFIPGSMA